MRHEKRDNINFYNGDNMEFMKNVPDKFYDLAIVDPPYFKGVADEKFYGAEVSSIGVKRLCSSSKHWDEGIPNQDYYDELVRVSKHQIIWGCNYYAFNQPSGRIVWDKENDSSTFSNCELASISLIDSVKIFRYMWNGMLQKDMKNKEKRIHPTQKPIKLYRWLLQNYAKQGDKILDTHGGSMTHAIACDMEGYELDIIEIDEDYFNDGLKAFDNYKRQLTLF